MYVLAIILMLALVSSSQGFQVPTPIQPIIGSSTTTTSTSLPMIFGNKNKNSNDDESYIAGKKMTRARRKKLGVNDNEEEYDLEMALDNSTDPLITKIIAGSLILSITALLVAGLIIPLTTDYGEGVCNPLLTSGRC